MKRSLGVARLFAAFAFVLVLTAAHSSTAAASGLVHSPYAGSTVLAFPTQRYARVLVYATLHTVGEGAGVGSDKSPLSLYIKVFDRKKVGSPKPEDYAAIWNSTFGLTTSTILWYSSVVKIGGGPAMLYPVWVPAKDPFYQENSGSYAVIGKARVDWKDVYVGVLTDTLYPGDIVENWVQIIRNSKGKLIAIE